MAGVFGKSEHMREPNRKDDKIEAAEIHIGGVKRQRDGAKSRAGKWFENFWYHHKWKTIIALVLAIILLVCTLQMCAKESEDMTVMLVGPYQLNDSEAGYVALKYSLSSYLPDDYDNNGKKNTAIVHYAVYSKEQIELLKQNVDENGESAPIYIDTAQNSSNYEQYESYLMTGETSVLFLDPWLFEQMREKRDEYLVNIEARYKTLPVGALMWENEDGALGCYGVRLGDTALYQNAAVSAMLPPDTVIVLAHKHFYASEKKYERSVAYFASLVGID